MKTLYFTNHKPHRYLAVNMLRHFLLGLMHMPSCLLTSNCPPMQDWEAEADTGPHLMGVIECCKQKLGWLSLLFITQ